MVGRSLQEPPTYGAYGHQRPCTLAHIHTVYTRGQRAHMVELTEHSIQIINISSKGEELTHLCERDCRPQGVRHGDGAAGGGL